MDSMPLDKAIERGISVADAHWRAVWDAKNLSAELGQRESPQQKLLHNVM
jgi:hypothetical protein